MANRAQHDAEPAAAPAPAAPALDVAGPAIGMPLGPGGDFSASMSRLDPPSRARSVLGLQRAHGNQAVARAIAGDAGGGDPPKAPATGLVVAEDADPVEPHQLKKSQLLGQLRSAASAAAEAALSGLFWADLARPKVTEELEQRFAAYAGMEPAALEAALRQEAPEAAAARSASELVAAIAREVGRAVTERLADERPPEDKDGGGGSAGDFLASAGALASKIGGMLFKRRGDASPRDADPAEVRRGLGAGQTLPATTVARMQEAFGGEDFSVVRVHTDASAGRAADSFDARAFTVGSDIAFGPGEFQPGTLAGDALIAHELAHVVQQRSASAAVDAARTDGANEGALEEDADLAAMQAVSALHGLEPAGARPGLLARMRTGLRLQRCGKSPGSTVVKTMNKANTPNPGKGLWYWPNYRDECDKHTPGFTWDEKYRLGFSQTSLLTRTGKPFEWTLVPGAKPSAAVREWTAGLTVADCASVGAASYYTAILEEAGEEKFDRYFASDGKHALVIGQFMKRLPLNQLVFEPNRSVSLEEGDWYYFQNHPMYEKKHPAGLWSGENAVYLGDGMWGGFGVAPQTQEQLEKTLVARYKDARGADDERELAKMREPNGKLPKEWELDKAGGDVPDDMTLDELKKSGGGLQPTGWRISKARLGKQMGD
jgi:hypothetical protein